MYRAAFQLLSAIFLATVWAIVGAADRLPWIQGNHVVIALSPFEGAGSKSYELWMAGTGDARIEEVKETAGKKSKGSLLLVGGRFLAIRDIDVHRGMEIDAIDIPVLNWQLVAQLLERSIPNGPGPTLPLDEVKVSESAKGIEVGTTSAGGEYGAPWTVTAKVSRDAKGMVHYRLDFQFTDQESGKLSPPMQISGLWEHQEPRPNISDELSLVGWKLFSLGPVKKNAKDGQILDYSSSTLEETAKTVGDLRKLASNID